MEPRTSRPHSHVSLDSTSPSLTLGSSQTLPNDVVVTVEKLEHRTVEPVVFYDGNLSTATRTIYTFVLPIVCAFGILGIALTLVVLMRKTMRTSTNCYLIALSFADLIFLILLGSMLVLEHCAGSVEDANATSIIVIYSEYAKIVTNMALMASVWITVMLAVERYVAICRPFVAGRLCTVRTSVLVICIVFAAAFICRLPNFWENKVTWVRDPFDPTNSTYVVSMDWTSLADDPSYVTVYPWVVDGALTSILPFIGLLVLNASLVREVHRSTSYLQRHSTIGTSIMQREELQISVMLIGIVVVFFVCQTPYVIYSAATSISGDPIEPTPGLLLFQRVAILLLTLKSAINFIVYCWFSEKFRATLRRVFYCSIGGMSAMNAHGGENTACFCCCCILHGPCCRYSAVDGEGRRSDAYCSVKMQTTAFQLT